MEPTPLASCSLSQADLREQLARYRTAGGAAEVLEHSSRRQVIRVRPEVPESLIERLIEVERGCCPFFELTWDRQSRVLTVEVPPGEHEPALQAIGSALGVAPR